jgi:dTDP-4-dehydrorhamnose reductase
MTVLIGAGGWLGQAFQRALEARGEAFIPLGRADFPAHNPAPLTAQLRRLRPSFLINAAGFCGKPNVDACETQMDACREANVTLPATLQTACRELNLRWGHVSSGCIYTGPAPSPHGFRESDPPNFTFEHGNCSFYSGTKARADALLREDPLCLVWRPRLPFEPRPGPRNLITKLIDYPRLLDARNSISQVDECVEACLRSRDLGLPGGPYHLTQPGSLTTREMVEALRRHGLLRGEKAFFASEADFRATVAAPRSHCVLDTRKLTAAGIPLRPVAESWEITLRRYGAP